MKYSYYKNLAKSLINKDQIEKDPKNRASTKVIELMNTNQYCYDVHTHFFDMKCINSSYFIRRTLKDFLKMRGESNEEELIEKIYAKSHIYTEGWNEKLAEVYQEEANKRGGIPGVLFKLLWMTEAEQVYKYYLKDSSLATYFGYKPENVITTVLMMDFKMGWHTEVGKSIYKQIQELKTLSTNYPVLPFLFCDPRRAELMGNEENLYSLFNYAFTGPNPFSGVKIYPSLGYNPSDYRLWPIYEICEELSIPIISHCGGTAVSPNDREVETFIGNQRKLLSYPDRKLIGEELNDPKHWELVLEKFPRLKVNIAHFGGIDTWKDTGPVEEDKQKRKERIIKLMNKKDSEVYSDFSFTIVDKDATKNFVTCLNNKGNKAAWKKLKSRSMFGSDYWVVSKEGQLKKKQENFLNTVKNEDLIKKLCKTNPENFLFEKIEMPPVV